MQAFDQITQVNLKSRDIAGAPTAPLPSEPQSAYSTGYGVKAAHVTSEPVSILAETPPQNQPKTDLTAYINYVSAKVAAVLGPVAEVAIPPKDRPEHGTPFQPDASIGGPGPNMPKNDPLAATGAARQRTRG
jgi:hypothetical protein